MRKLGIKRDFEAANSRNELLIQTAGITEQITDKRNFTGPSNKVKNVFQNKYRAQTKKYFFLWNDTGTFLMRGK